MIQALAKGAPVEREDMKAVTVGSATLDIIATVADDDIERMTLHNQTASFLLLEPGRKVDAEAIATHTGGGAVNAAVSLARQGFDVQALVKIGDDLNGAKVLERLAEAGVNIDLVLKHDKQATAVSLLIASHDRNAAIFTHRGANGYLQDDDVSAARFADADLVYTTSLSNDSASLFPHIVARAKDANAFVAANPGIRQLTTKTGPLFDSLRFVDLFICNLVEATALVPKLVSRTGWQKGKALQNGSDPASDRPTLNVEGFILTLEDYAERLHGLGVPYVCITDGAQGAYLSHESEIVFQPSILTEVAGTIGAGDAFSSTLAGSLVKGKTREESLLRAARNAAAVVAQVDAQSGLLTTTQLDKLPF